MARPDGAGPDGARALVELKAVDTNYPLYGTLVTEPPLPRQQLFDRHGDMWGAAVAPNLLVRLGVKWMLVVGMLACTAPITESEAALVGVGCGLLSLAFVYGMDSYLTREGHSWTS